MKIIVFNSWEPIARYIIQDFICNTEMYVKDDRGLFEKVQDPVEFLNKVDDSRMYSIFSNLYTGGREEWSTALQLQLEERLIQKCYILNQEPGTFEDFEEEFLEDHFRVEKKYIYDLLFEYGKERIVQILQEEKERE